MRIVSVNTGKPTEIVWQGKSELTGIFKYPSGDAIFLGFDDVATDSVIDRKHHGGKDKACYLYSADRYNYWQELFPDTEMPWGMFGENLTVEGLDEDHFNIGDILEAGEATIQVTQPRQPCYKLNFRFENNDMVRKFVQSGFPGVYVRVLRPGTVKKGDQLKLVEKCDSVSVKKVFQMLYGAEPDNDLLQKIISNPYLAESCRKDLLKRWG